MKRVITIIVAMLMAVSMLSGIVLAKGDSDLYDTSKIFKDVNSTSWYIEAVNYAYTNNIFKGITENTFEPNSPMNRAMFVTVLGRMSGIEPSNNVATAFKDVPAGKWYTGYVKWAANGGIVKGITETSFEPLTNITREQMCTMLVRYANFENITIDRYNSKVIFADDLKIKEYAKESVYICQMSGLVNGMTATTFEPAGTATRAQVAKILMIFSELYLKNDSIDDEESLPDTPETPETPDTPETPVLPPVTDKSEKELIIGGEANRYVMPSFDIDSTGFVKSGTKLTDFAGKTLTFFTSDNYAVWGYRDSTGKFVNEWEWFKLLKSELGLNIKYTVKQYQASINSALQAMNAGKSLDIIYTDRITFPQSLCISKDISSLINVNAKTPGISKKVMTTVKWGNGYRIISPVGSVDVLWYNKTLSDSLNLTDPHTTWENGNWNWNSFKAYLYSAPNTVSGSTLTAYTNWPNTHAFVWPATNGSPTFLIDAKAAVPTIVNNWSSPATTEAWEFIANTCNSINYGGSAESSPSIQLEYIGLFEGSTLMAGSMYTNIYRNYEYAKNIELDWVPYPKSNNKGGKEICQFMGYGMMLPKKTVRANMEPVALKFMELWATRFSESIFDNFKSFEYFNFSNDDISQFYDYCEANVSFASYLNNLNGVSNPNYFFRSFNGSGSHNPKTEASKLNMEISYYIMESMKYGL